MLRRSSKNSSKAKDYEALGRMLESIYESGYINRAQTYKMSFIKGVVAGFGGVIGATVVVAILLYILSLLHSVPFVNRITDNFRATVEQSEMR